MKNEVLDVVLAELALHGIKPVLKHGGKHLRLFLGARRAQGLCHRPRIDRQPSLVAHLSRASPPQVSGALPMNIHTTVSDGELAVARDKLDRAVELMQWTLSLRGLLRRDFFVAVNLDLNSVAREVANLKIAIEAHR